MNKRRKKLFRARQYGYDFRKILESQFKLKLFHWQTSIIDFLILQDRMKL